MAATKTPTKTNVQKMTARQAHERLHVFNGFNPIPEGTYFHLKLAGERVTVSRETVVKVLEDAICCWAVAGLNAPMVELVEFYQLCGEWVFDIG